VVRVALVAPEPSAFKAKKKFKIVAQNLDGVADLLVDTEVLTVAQGAGAKAIEDTLMEKFRGFLKGPGKPKGSKKKATKAAKKSP
jgi:hypothetical protein